MLVMTSPDQPVTRRAVVRTTAVAAAGAAVAAAPAAAGDCYETRGDTEVYDQACPAEDRIGVIEGGTQGELGIDSCVDEFGTEWVYFTPYTDLSLAGWVRRQSLEPC